MFFTIADLLSKDKLARVQDIIARARFSDGAATADVGRETKNNLEMQVDESYLRVVEILNNAVDGCERLRYRLFPRYRSTPIINRFDKEMYYRTHVDAPVQGVRTQFGAAPGKFGQGFLRTDYSMTLFLTDPETYDGGELELDLGEDRKLVKLPAGSAVCYQTGIFHAVRKVTRGSRICGIYWFQSYIGNMGLRRTLWDLHCLCDTLASVSPGKVHEDAANIEANLIRYLADI
jgi:PKHD-type hydroxylase